jgi:hypothetical protein
MSVKINLQGNQLQQVFEHQTDDVITYILSLK